MQVRASSLEPLSGLRGGRNVTYVLVSVGLRNRALVRSTAFPDLTNPLTETKGLMSAGVLHSGNSVKVIRSSMGTCRDTTPLDPLFDD